MIPKFRAWDTFKKKWVKYFYITENGLIYNMEQQHRDLIGAVPIEKSGLILMQSTGLFDKNGVEIFEGDVVQSQASPHQEDWKNWKVSWNDGAFQADYKDIPADKRRRPTNEVEEVCQDNVNLYGWAVIGNIHEHPHLVEGGG